MTDIYQAPVVLDPDTQGTPPPADIQIPDAVLELVGEGKKYATLADALKSIPHAQKHISTLEEEMKALREAQGKSLSQEEVYAAVQDYLKQNAGQGGSGLDEKAVDGLLDRKLKAREAEAAASANVADFKSAMGQKFGDKQSEVFVEKAKELGVTPAYLSDLVRTSPKAAKALFGLDATKAPPRSAVVNGLNTAALTPDPDASGTKSLRGMNTRDLTAEWKRIEAKVLGKA